MIKPGFRICLYFFVILFLFGLSGRSENASPDDLKQRLEKEIGQLSEEYSRIRSSQNAIMDEVERLRLQSEILSREVELLSLRLEETRKLRKKVHESLNQNREQLRRYQVFVEKRILAMARLGPAYPLKMALSLHWGPDLMRAFFYAGAFARLDRRILQRYRNLIHELNQQKTYLAELETALDQQTRQYRRRQQQLEDVRRRKEVMLAQLQKRGEVYRQALQELTMAYNRLKEYVGASDYRPLLNIEKFKGLLDWPVRGEVIRRFGRIRLPETGTYIISRGIQIRTPEGTQVRAVFDGKVRYADWYTAYGKLVILDHGHDIYSLYAHNKMLLVRKGDIVRRGQVIAISGSTASLNGPMLYFEIRRRVNAENPLDWLRIPSSWGAQRR